MIIGYFGDGPWSHKALEKLLVNLEVEVAFVCGRHGKKDPVLEKKAYEASIPFITHPDINSEEFRYKFDHHAVDLFVSMSFDQIFSEKMIATPKCGIINCHAGKLPFYRGRNILNWVLINDEKEFGITVHHVDSGIDTGDIIRQKSFPITDDDDYKTLLMRAHQGCADLLVQSVEDLRTGKARRIEQKSIHQLGSYFSARGPGDERLDWNQTSRKIFNFVRAICPPGPAARCFLGLHEIKINKVEFLSVAPLCDNAPGAVLEKNENYFLVKTLDSCLCVSDWEADKKIEVGDVLE